MRGQQLISWKCKVFSQLDAEEIFEILKLRQEVFIVEQSCVYNDIDELDKRSLHLCGYRAGQVAVAPELCLYARLIAPGIKSKEAAIGRVLVKSGFRGAGLGVVLMRQGLTVCAEKFPVSAVRISAQAHLEMFYQSLGFTVISEPYDEDGISHIDMLKLP